MASVQSIALTAAGLTAGMWDFCTRNSLGVAYDGPDAERSLLVIWGAGCLERHAELVQYAPMVAARTCTEFCVNGHLAGNCHLVWRHNEFEKTRRT